MGGWRQALEMYGFRLSRSKIKYMECITRGQAFLA